MLKDHFTSLPVNIDTGNYHVSPSDLLVIFSLGTPLIPMNLPLSLSVVSDLNCIHCNRHYTPEI